VVDQAATNTLAEAVMVAAAGVAGMADPGYSDMRRAAGKAVATEDTWAEVAEEDMECLLPGTQCQGGW